MRAACGGWQIPAFLVRASPSSGQPGTARAGPILVAEQRVSVNFHAFGEQRGALHRSAQRHKSVDDVGPALTAKALSSETWGRWTDGPPRACVLGACGLLAGGRPPAGPPVCQATWVASVLGLKAELRPVQILPGHAFLTLPLVPGEASTKRAGSGRTLHGAHDPPRTQYGPSVRSDSDVTAGAARPQGPQAPGSSLRKPEYRTQQGRQGHRTWGFGAQRSSDYRVSQYAMRGCAPRRGGVGVTVVGP